MRKPLAIIGMSPGNSYFKDVEVRFLLQEAIKRFGECVVMVADVPAISTYIAMGYSPNKARNKAIPKGNNLKNRTRRIAEELGFSADQVRIVDWDEEVENNISYQDIYKKTLDLYQSNTSFRVAVQNTSRSVLSAGKQDPDIPSNVLDHAVHYLLSEIAFLEHSPNFFGVDRTCYIYHKNWPVYEDYVRGVFDEKDRSYLDFLLLEAPYETYTRLHSDEMAFAETLHDTYSRVMDSHILRAAYVDYPPVMYRKPDGSFSGIFHDIIMGFAQRYDLDVRFVEETGYGVIINGLSEGRFDIFCSATWPTPERHKYAALTLPLYYSNVGVWVRADSPLAAQDWLSLDTGLCKVAITEGDITHSICLTDFVHAKWVRVPQLSGVRGLLQTVADGRADATIVEEMTYNAYKDQLSAPLVNIAQQYPIRRYSNSFLIAKNQNDFLDLMNTYIMELRSNRQIETLLQRVYPPHEGIFIPLPDRSF